MSDSNNTNNSSIKNPTKNAKAAVTAAKGHGNAKEVNENSLSNKVTDVWVVSDYYAYINDYELCSADLVDFESVFGGCEIKARLKFLDTKGVTTGQQGGKTGHLGVGGFVKIGFTDPMGCPFEHEYVITSLKHLDNHKNQRLVQIDMVDKETRNMKGTFQTKGHPGKKFTEAIDKHYKDTGNKKKFNIVGPIKEALVNTVIPSHIDFHTFLTKEAKFRGFKFIKDRFANYLVHAEHLEFNKLMKLPDIFEIDAKQFSFGRIVQTNLQGFNFEALAKSVPTSVMNIDNILNNSLDFLKDGVSTLIHQKPAEKSQSDKKNATVKISDISKITRGQKQAVAPNNNKQTFNTLNNVNKGSIWVPGRNGNMVGKKITVNLPNVNSYSKGSDEMHTGEYEVYAVRDKIVGGGYFMQELFIRRPGQS